MIKKSQLVESHHEWKKYIKEWEFLMDSYVGGQEYKEGEYLTSYVFESREEYEERLENTAMDNHVRALVAIYNSFLFRQAPKRNFGSLENDPGLAAFLEDADLDGRSFDSIMKDVSTYATIYGHTWILIDKPSTVANTRAEELDQGIRPYISIYTPENVLDWNYRRTANGQYKLDYLKIYEGNDSGRDVFKIYTPDNITTISIGAGEADGIVETSIVNALGMIPAVAVYSQRGQHRGTGISDVADVAKVQRAIYNELSELEQIERISNHPSLVRTPGVNAAAGAGSMIIIPEDTPEGLRPYLLQPSGASIDSLLNSINQKIQAIDRMSHMGGIRSIESRRLSGVALATEFQLLNARLADKASNLEHAEEQIWRIFSLWQGTVWTGTVEYPDSFNIQDKYNDINMLKLAKDAGVKDPILNAEIEDRMLRIIVDEDRYNELKAAPPKDVIVHRPVINAADLVTHLREMVQVGYTDEEILGLHPEIETLFSQPEVFEPIQGPVS